MSKEKFSFDLLKEEGLLRVGKINTHRGEIDTPTFMTVGTLGTIKSAAFLDRQYTVFGKVIEGMEFVDLIRKGEGSNGEVSEPDKILSISKK